MVGTSTFGGTTVDETVSYEYTGTNHNQPTKKTVSNSKGETLISKMYYPGDLSSEPFMSNLIAQNRKATPVKLETYKNATALGDKLSEQKTVYANDATTSNLVLPKSIYEAKFPNSLPSILNVGQLERKVTSDLYNTNGILLQFTPENGQPVSMIWGYNKTQPIAKIENATYAEITGQVANLQTLSNTGTEANLILALTNLRTSLPNAMITTYTYRPLIGVSTTTDPKGNVTYYNYDGLGRLQNVKDAKGNILSENQYHYKN